MFSGTMVDTSNIVQSILDRAPIGIAVISYEGMYISVNSAYSSIYGYTVDEMVGQSFLMVFPEEARASVLARHQAFLDIGGKLGGDWTVVRRDGTRLPIYSDSTLFPTEVGPPARLVYVLDMSEQEKSKEQQRIAATVFQSTSEAILVTDADNKIIATNPAFSQLTGFTLDEVKGLNPRIFKSNRHNATFYQEMWRSLTKTGLWSGEIWDLHKNGDSYIKDMTITVVKDASGKVQNYVSVFSDITERKMAEDIIRQQANYDSVTGLPNRHLFLSRLEEGARFSDREGSKMVLLLIDLDHFKEVNDTQGHKIGDRLLAEVASRLTDHVRPEDTIARIGGDEFALILSGLTDDRDIEVLAEDILKCIETPASIDGVLFFVTASIGISIYVEGMPSLEDLFKNADQALYAAKELGRNRIHFFTPALERAAMDRMRLAADLREAISAGQLEVHYQPIMELGTDRMKKAEALIRWRHPTRGFISPAEFIPVAEETGLILQLGEWVARQAITDVVRWRRDFSPHFQVTINLSPIQFRCNRFSGIGWLVEMLAQGLDSRAICVEITEGLLLDAEPTVMSNLKALHDAGVQIALDDFGTGYSSLSYLRKFQIDTLKIDRSFVSELDGPSLDICEAIIAMAHRLGIKVVAEGVETERQRDVLRSIGCDFVKGFLYAPAIPADGLEQMMRMQWAEPNTKLHA